jgi:hypothetical protein
VFIVESIQVKQGAEQGTHKLLLEIKYPYSDKHSAIQKEGSKK